MLGVSFYYTAKTDEPWYLGGMLTLILVALPGTEIKESYEQDLDIQFAQSLGPEQKADEQSSQDFLFVRVSDSNKYDDKGVLCVRNNKGNELCVYVERENLELMRTLKELRSLLEDGAPRSERVVRVTWSEYRPFIDDTDELDALTIDRVLQ